MLGATSEEVKAPDENVRDICEKIRKELEQKLGKTFSEFTPLAYRSQLVNGVNYFIKIRIDPSEHLHVRAHKAFSGEITLSNHQTGKSTSDAIDYFE